MSVCVRLSLEYSHVAGLYLEHTGGGAQVRKRASPHLGSAAVQRSMLPQSGGSGACCRASPRLPRRLRGRSCSRRQRKTT
eukprot:scaffold5688_cov116-Isochrysis_galbana.AAC.5